MVEGRLDDVDIVVEFRIYVFAYEHWYRVVAFVCSLPSCARFIFHCSFVQKYVLGTGCCRPTLRREGGVVGQIVALLLVPL